MQERQLTRTAAEFANEIQAQWNTATHAIYETCRLLNEARAALKPGHADTPEWLEFKRRLPFGDGVLKKLMVIGGYAPLRKQSLQKRLPPNYTIIYEVTQLDPVDELPLAIRNNEIHPKMRRQEFIQWRSELRTAESATSHSGRTVKSKPEGIFVSISSTKEITSQEFSDLQRDIKKLVDRYELLADFGKQAEKAKRHAKEEILASLRAELSQQMARVTNDLDQDELDLLESTAFQMRRYQDIRDRKAKGDSSITMIYDPSDPVSIEHPKHPFYVEKWDNSRFFSYLGDRNVVTQWTPVERLVGFGELEMLARAISLLEATSEIVREKHLRKLKNVVSRKSTNAPHARKILKLIEAVI